MSTVSVTLRETPLLATHREEGGRLVEFAGWKMPVQYEGIAAEHEAVRKGAGIFDVSHMGQIRVTGNESERFLDQLLPAPVRRLSDGQMLYTPLCNTEGKCIDDLVLFRFSHDNFLLVVNAARTEIDWAWVGKQACSAADVQLSNESAGTAMLAIQGPMSSGIIERASDGFFRKEPMGYYRFSKAEVAGISCLVSRNGYTGEDGFELMCDWAEALPLWSALRRAGAAPCGLGARDTLRTEMGYPLYGHELTEETTPLEAGIEWTLDLEKRASFVGKEALRALKASGQHRLLRGLRMIDRGIPRAGYAVVDSSQRDIGTVSSGTQSPSLGRGIGLAFIERGHHRYGSEVYIKIRKQLVKAEVVQLPFVTAKTVKSLSMDEV